MADTLVEGDAGRATSTLLGSTSAGSQVALILYGLYLAVHVRYVSSDLYARLASRVKVVLWTVFALLTAYSGLVFADVVHWSSAYPGISAEEAVKLTEGPLGSHHDPLAD